MAEADPGLRLTYADHTLIHACCFFLSDTFTSDWDEMVITALRSVLPDVNEGNPALKDFVDLARQLVALPAHIRRGPRQGWPDIISKYHLRRMSAAWDQIRENYDHGNGTSRAAGEPAA